MEKIRYTYALRIPVSLHTDVPASQINATIHEVPSVLISEVGNPSFQLKVWCESSFTNTFVKARVFTSFHANREKQESGSFIIQVSPISR